MHNHRPNDSAPGKGAGRGTDTRSPRVPMHEFSVLATIVVIAAVYFGLFLAAEKFFMK